eukprot:Opistho-2@42963
MAHSRPQFSVIVSSAIADNNDTLRSLLDEAKRNDLIAACRIIVCSHQQERLANIRSIAEEIWPGITNERFLCIPRGEDIRDYITTAGDERFVVLGCVEKDLHLANNLKLLLLAAMWMGNQVELKVVQYGLHVGNAALAMKIVRFIMIPRVFLSVTDPFTQQNVEARVWCLASGNTMGRTPVEQAQLAKRFRNLLKASAAPLQTDETFTALLCYFVGAILSQPEFVKVDIWTIAPSSKCDKRNETMWTIKEKVRETMGKKLSDPVFERVVDRPALHETSPVERQNAGPDWHLGYNGLPASIRISQKYPNEKLRGKTVCVLDDFMTNGATFEALRALLIAAGVERIYFVSFGRFGISGGTYNRVDYTVNGNVRGIYQATRATPNPASPRFVAESVTSLEDILDLIKVMNNRLPV